MKKLFSLTGCWVIGALALLASPDPLFLNEGLLTQPLAIDATTFVNTGTIEFGSTGSAQNPVVAFETQNTLNYTNRGLISIAPGMNFQFVNDAGFRSMSSSFYNGPGARVSGNFSDFTGNLGPWQNVYQPLYGGFVGIYATNIVNRGTIEGFYSGDVQIHGVNVDLRSSRIGEGAIPFSTYFAGETNFFPETDLRDRWWRYSDVGINLDQLANLDARGNLTVQTPRFRIYRQFVAQPDDTGGPYVSLSLINPLAFVAKLQPSETNQQFEVVFVSNPDPAVTIDVNWEPGFDPVNAPAYTARVRFTTVQPDLVSQGPSAGANQFIIEDTYGSDPNEVLQSNLSTGTTQKPYNLSAFRAFPPQFIPGAPIGPVSTNSDFYQGMFTKWIDDVYPDGVTMTNLITTNRYATWSANLERYPSSLVGVSGPGGSLTNLAGRVMIVGENLNLSNTRIQGQSLVSIQTDNLISAHGAVIDAPILNLDLASKDGNLTVQDLAKGSPSRFGGDFAIWSTTFTNFWQVTGTNAATTGTPIDVDGDGVIDGCDTNGDGVIDAPGDCPTDPGAGAETTTNYTAIYHVTVIQNNLTSGVGIFLNDLRVRGANVDLRDQINIDQRFFASAQNLTVSGSLNLFNQNNLTDADLVGLQTLTNLGGITVPGLISIGVASSPTLSVIANAANFESAGINVKADRIENSGALQADGGNLQINGGDFINNGGSLNANFDIIINSTNANLSGVHAVAKGLFSLNVPGSLTDGGVDFPGLVEATYGVNLGVPPASGNLLGTTFSIVAPENGFSDSFWAGDDVGENPTNYTNNVPLGVLSLDVEFGGVVSFSAVGSKNAIYVERLELSDLLYVDRATSLIVNEGMTIYYASTSDNVDPTVLNGPATGGGYLRYVKQISGSGAAESVSVRLGDGRSIRVPKALRFSQTLDSDGDGIVNAVDTSPFDLIVFSRVELVQVDPPFFRVEWIAIPGQTYEVQSTADLKGGAWSTVKTIRNITGSIGPMVFEEPVEPGAQGKSYRVIVSP